MLLVGDLNLWVGDAEIDGVIGKFEVPGVNEIDERLVEMGYGLGV